MTDLDEKRGVSRYVLALVFLGVLSLGFAAGVIISHESLLPDSCDGYLTGSILGYECYDDSIVGVCLDGNGSLRTQSDVEAGLAWLLVANESG